MDGSYCLKGQGSTTQWAANYVPHYPNYETGRSRWFPYAHAPSGQKNLDPAGTPSLETQVAVLKFQLAEREKEIMEARSLIAYLLKRNAFARSDNISSHVCKSKDERHEGDTTRLIVEAVKDFSIAVIAALSGHGHANGEDLASFRPRTSTSSSAVGEDLLDFSDASPAQTITPKKKSHSSQEGCSPLESAAQLSSQGNLKDQEDCVPLKQSPIPTGGKLPLENLDFPPLPYITRFPQARKSQDPCIRPCSSSSCDQPSHGSSSQSSLIGSDDDLSGFPQYKATDSTGLTSLNSSFHGSNDEVVEFGRCTSTDSLESNGIQQDLFSCIREGTPHSVPPIFPSRPGNPRPITVTQDGSQCPVQASAALFLPKWPARSFALLAEEREGAIFIHKRAIGLSGSCLEENPFPDFFKYGLRICPNPMGPNLCRTVMVDYLPQTLTVFALLQKVRGGAVADAKILDVVAITGFKSAMITFVHARGARAFMNNARLRPLEFEGIRARVTLLPTPTWPMPTSLFSGIVDAGLTRCLEVHNFPRDVKPAQLENDLRFCPAMTSHPIEAKRMRADGVLELRLTSVRYARRAYGVLTNGPYIKCKVFYAPDPCAQAWDEHAGKSIPVVNKPSPEAKALDVAHTAASNACKTSHIPANPHAEHSSVDSPILEPQTGRLTPIDPHIPAAIHRGRGFSSEAPHPKTDDTCLQQ
ncbi:MAG: hypothetical protein Q9216_003572 [Gyalolechia sp. 2 TL-2023]